MELTEADIKRTEEKQLRLKIAAADTLKGEFYHDLEAEMLLWKREHPRYSTDAEREAIKDEFPSKVLVLRALEILNVNVEFGSKGDIMFISGRDNLTKLANAGVPFPGWRAYASGGIEPERRERILGGMSGPVGI